MEDIEGIKSMAALRDAEWLFVEYISGVLQRVSIGLPTRRNLLAGRKYLQNSQQRPASSRKLTGQSIAIVI